MTARELSELLRVELDDGGRLKSDDELVKNGVGNLSIYRVNQEIDQVTRWIGSAEWQISLLGKVYVGYVDLGEGEVYLQEAP